MNTVRYILMEQYTEIKARLVYRISTRGKKISHNQVFFFLISIIYYRTLNCRVRRLREIYYSSIGFSNKSSLDAIVSFSIDSDLKERYCCHSPSLLSFQSIKNKVKSIIKRAGTNRSVINYDK